jgi:hypothetical protein
LFALVEPILRLAEELASRTVSGRLRRRLSEERKTNTLFIDVKGGLSSSLPFFGSLFFIFAFIAIRAHTRSWLRS